MRIGELSERTGVSTRLLRYYEAQGLLESERSSNGYRHYADNAPELVAQIRGLLAAGLPTATIRAVLPCAHGPDPQLYCEDTRRRLENERASIDARIEALMSARTALDSYIERTVMLA